LPTIAVFNLCVAVSLLFLTLFDYYIVGIRIMDFVALLMLILSLYILILRKSVVYSDERDIRKLLPMFLLISIYVIFGIASDTENVKACLGLMLGVTAFGFFYIVPLSSSNLYRYLGIGLYIHTSLMLFQFIYYYTTGTIFNFHAILNIEPRLLSTIFRPAGLFQEPAVYCLSCFLILTLRQRIRPGHMEASDWYTALTLPITFSFWGIGALLVYLSFVRLHYMIILLTAVLAVFSYVMTTTNLDENSFFKLGQTRIFNAEADGSVQDRYGGVKNLLENPLGSTPLWFGRGANTDFIDVGGNAFSFMLNSFGIIGSLMFFFIYFTLNQKAGLHRNLFFVLFTLTAAPIWTGMAYWVWLSLMAKPYERSFTAGYKPSLSVDN
jgi:hypothetical protein